MSVHFGCSDHNVMAVVRKPKVSKAGAVIIVKRSYKHFQKVLLLYSFIEDVKNICWENVSMNDDPHEVPETFNKLFVKIID